MKRRQRTCPDNHGFTLIEVLVAMVTFSIGSLGVAALLTTSMKANIMAHHRSFAVAFAQDKVEEVRAVVVTWTDSSSQSVQLQLRI